MTTKVTTLIFLFLSTLSINILLAQETIVAPNSLRQSLVTDGFNSVSEAELLKREALYEKAYREYCNSSNEEKDLLTVYQLPIVFHIINQENGTEITNEEAVYKTLADVNAAFSNVGYYNSDTGVDVRIQFCLAAQSPTGITSNGITKSYSSLSVINEGNSLDLPNLISWNTTEYINVWIVRSINSIIVGVNPLAYSTFPTDHGKPKDGVVIESKFFGDSAVKSALLVHELGRYLGLYDIFYRGCDNGNCLQNGDRVCDTPPVKGYTNDACDEPFNSCLTDVNLDDENNPFKNDQNDLQNNFMDYGDLDCYNSFTEGQKTRMRYTAAFIRSSLFQTSCTEVDPSTSVVDIAEQVFSIYPNPATQQLNYENGVRPLKLYNAIGQLVYETTAVSGSIDVSNFPNGIYYLTDFKRTEKVVINN